MWHRAEREHRKCCSQREGVEVVENDLLKHLSKQDYLLLLCFHFFSSLEWQPLGWEENRIL